jgi:hypothetical protein
MSLRVACWCSTAAFPTVGRANSVVSRYEILTLEIPFCLSFILFFT